MSCVLVVEDESAIAELIAINLRHSGFQVRDRGADADAAQAQVDRELPDLILLDWMLPGQSGVQLAKRWRADARTRELPIIMLTARADEADKINGLDAGADDYLTKPFSTKELLARIRAVLRRKMPEALDVAVEVAGLRLDPATHRVTRRMGEEMREIKIGPTEFRLLHFFMTHTERVHSRAQLLDRVWGDHVFIEERTVDVHVKRLREALAPVQCSALIETVRGAGYRMTQQIGTAASLTPMEGLMARTLALWALLGVGALLGGGLGFLWGHGALGTGLGVALGGLLVAWRDHRHGQRLLAWLRDEGATQARRRWPANGARSAIAPSACWPARRRHGRSSCACSPFFPPSMPRPMV
jgi:two-component system phosphate regulon response regulator PhoB